MRYKYKTFGFGSNNEYVNIKTQALLDFGVGFSQKVEKLVVLQKYIKRIKN